VSSELEETKHQLNNSPLTVHKSQIKNL